MTSAALVIIGVLIGIGAVLTFAFATAGPRAREDRGSGQVDDAVVAELIRLLDLATGPAVVEQTRKVLAAAGVQECTPAVGDAFDPARHKAVHAEFVERISPGVIVRVERPGWSRDGTLIRAADVTVSAASSTEQEPR